MAEGSLWRVVGGVRSGGVVVRAARDTSSEQLPERLRTGAVVRELRLRGTRLHYEKLAGEGPKSGWVSVALSSGQELLARTVHPAADGGEDLGGACDGDDEAGEGTPNSPPTATGDRRSPEEDWEASAEVVLRPGPVAWRVEHASGVRVLQRPTDGSCPSRTKSTLARGDVVAVASRRGGWLCIASWEPSAGWVPPTAQGEASLNRCPGVLLGALQLRARVALAEGHLRKALDAGQPWLPLAGPGDCSVHNPMWGIEARCPAALGALEAPGRPWRVHAARAFAAGEVVERCEGLLSEEGYAARCSSTVALRGRLYRAAGLPGSLLPLGFGALYRQAGPEERPAAELVAVAAQGGEAAGGWQVVVRALRAVEAGEELTVRPPKGHAAAPLLDRREELECAEPAQGVRHLPPCGGCRLTAGAISVGPSRLHGRGVFAARAFERGDLVALCPALVLDRASIDTDPFPDYRMAFEAGVPPCPDLARRAAAARLGSGAVAPSALWWPPPGDCRAPRVAVIALGLGPLFNHAPRPGERSVAWTLHPGLGLVVMRAESPAAEGGELLIDYGSAYWAAPRRSQHP